VTSSFELKCSIKDEEFKNCFSDYQLLCSIEFVVIGNGGEVVVVYLKAGLLSSGKTEEDREESQDNY
jgi:hypothetical protein